MLNGDSGRSERGFRLKLNIESDLLNTIPANGTPTGMVNTDSGDAEHGPRATLTTHR
jgi:hypothetical protein